MKKKIIGTLISVAVFAVVMTAFRTEASEPEPPAECLNEWNMKGTYTIVFTCTLGCSGDRPHSMTVDNMTLETGEFSGYGYYIPNSSYTWDVTGDVDGDAIQFEIVYTGVSSGYTIEVVGEISQFGELTGSAVSSSSQEFSWVASSGKASKERCAEITSPKEKECVYGEVDFEAYLVDDDEDYVDWAVRKGTCDAGTNTVWGNVDGHSDPYEWEYNEDTNRYEFVSPVNTSTWDAGKYCFIFNPREDSGEESIRETRLFSINDDCDGDGVPDSEDLCLDTTADEPEEGLGTNRWAWLCDESGEDCKWETKRPDKKKGNGPNRLYSMPDTHGCSCKQILDSLDLGEMEGHNKHGCSIGIMDKWVEMHNDL